LATLADLAALVMNELELRLASRRAVTAESRLRREAEDLADALQASLMPPRPPQVPGMEVAARFIAGERGLKIGGDFFDVFRLATNDWGIIFGDACGKGADAASLAALTRWTLRATAVRQFRPSEVVTDLNAVLRADSDDDSHFCSVVFARLELDICGAWVTLASAGHPLPILVRSSGKIEARGFVDLPVGMFDAVYAVDDRVGLGPGDALVFYTDGVTEARDAAGELFGEERLLDALGLCVGSSAEATASRIIQSAKAFSASDIVDDVAVLVLRVPANAGDDPRGRVAAATGMPPDQLDLPGYPHDGGPGVTVPPLGSGTRR
jgi:sigma-B regulation protein RsbU (phosphoserine phosphatase)